MTLDAVGMFVWRSRSRPWLVVPGFVMLTVLLSGLTARHPAMAQIETKSAPSPAAPGDLTKPSFDTTTRVYDSVASLDKAASTVVAEVEGRPITLGDVGDRIRALPASLTQLPFDVLYPGILDQLIKQAALIVRAQQQGIDEEPAVRRRVKAAADLALSEEYLREVTAREVTETELLERYNRDIAGRPGPEEVHARVILTQTEKEATDLIAEIRGGADFAAVARRASRDTTAQEGGDLGFHTREGMNAEVGAVAFAVPVGQIAPNPVHGASGWFVVKMEERRQQPTPSFAAMREKLRNDLMREAVEPVAALALKDLKVRRYSFTGAEISSEKSDAH